MLRCICSIYKVHFYSYLGATHNYRPIGWTSTSCLALVSLKDSWARNYPGSHSQLTICTVVLAHKYVGLPILDSVLMQINPTSPLPSQLPEFDLPFIPLWENTYICTSSFNLEPTCSWHLPLPFDSKCFILITLPPSLQDTLGQFANA